MSLPHSRAPHSAGAPMTPPEALNAALLIDFDNVTMGMRSDLSKELKTLLNSDIIKGKVTVQRAYADWRRYPQYIVPLSENSVDLIFAPAYGSSKKNATDIRMAIDGMELVFIRPEIGTYILLTGDSDFSSLVLKLKEYGKYVIGVGIQESSSDILVQNCDEYYSYTSLTGLRKTTDSLNKAVDPWVLVEQAAQKMASRSDVMRSDRLKQVMMEIDPTFDEGNFGFSKFSRFLSEAASRDLVELRKLENGQYEVRPKTGDRDAGTRDRAPAQRRTGDRSRSREKERDVRGPAPKRGRTAGRPDPRGEKGTRKGTQDPPAEGVEAAATGVDPLQSAYGLLRDALKNILDGNGGAPVRDSDLKRKMLELDPSFDESELGFGKFSRFLRQAHDHEVVDLEKREEGTYQVSFFSSSAEKGAEAQGTTSVSKTLEGPPKTQAGDGKAETSAPDDTLPTEEFGKTARIQASKGLGPRRGERRGRKGRDGPPALLAGQVVSIGGGSAKEGKQDPVGVVDVATLGLPTDRSAIISYLSNSYKGVGNKTAESLVEALGSELFAVMASDPAKIESIVSVRRAEQLLEGWKVDLQRRMERQAQESAPMESAPEKPRQRDPKQRKPRSGRQAPAAEKPGPSPEKEAPVERVEVLNEPVQEASPPAAGPSEREASAEGHESPPAPADEAPVEEAAPRKPLARGRRTRRGGRSPRG